MTKKFIFPSNQALPILWSSLNDSAEFKNLVIRYLKQEKITDFFALASSINLNLNAFLPYRFGLTAKTPEELIQKLEDNHYKTVTNPQKPTLVFLFPGQGESYADLTKSLYEKLPAFKKAIGRCASEFKKYAIDLMPSLYPVIPNKSNKQNLARYVTSFAVGYALSEVWRSFGIMPDKVLGHSDGEYTAAVVSGILSLEDAIFLISQRLKLIETKTVSGSMLAVLCNLATVKKIIAEFNIENTASTVTLAVINSFEDMVIAGSEKDILAIKQKFELYNIRTRDLEIISHAFHSKLMQPILAEFKEVANKVSYSAPNIPFISALEAKPVTDITGEYWEKHIIDPVNFQSAVSTLLQENQVQSLCFLELGINAMLSHLVKKNVSSALCFTSLDAKHEAWEGIAATLVELYMAGFSIDFHRFYGVHNHFPAFIEKLRNQQLALASLQGNTLSHSTEPEEPIAIIGFSCRFPGNLDNPEEFWEALLQSKDCMSPAPARSWDSALYDSLEMKPPKIGGWINKPDYFDPAFFNCSTTEAITMDPQQRMLMLTTWEALEHAGISLTELREKNKQGQRIGICAGISLSDYGNLLARQHINNAWVPSGNAYSAAAGRLAMFLGVEGPTFAIDAACSSSLVTVHTAVQQLRSGESDLAICGAVNVIIGMGMNASLTQANMLAPDGISKVFDEKANGYGRSEGCGVVILKRLKDAERDGDKIYAVISSSTVSQDGIRQGISFPNSAAQERLLTASIKKAGIRVDEIQYIEAHGTGTPVGDKAEMQALARVYQNVSQPIMIGAVKGNIGHTETAAGMAGLIKAIFVLRNQIVPPNIHLDKLSSQLQVPSHFRFPKRSERLSIENASVSAFGFTGTIANVIVKTYKSKQTQLPNTLPNVFLLLLAAKNTKALYELIEKFKLFLPKKTDTLANITYTSQIGREHFPVRAAVIASDHEEALRKLTAGDFFVYKSSKPTARKMVFAFTGQGSQYSQMGLSLYNTQPVFKEALDQCQELFRQYGKLEFLPILFTKDEQSNALLNQTRYAQIALFSIEYALSRLWQSWGIQPDCVLGHSVGEYAAAVIANVMSLEEAVKLIEARGRLMENLPQQTGKMVIVRGPAQAIRRFYQELPIKEIDIAAINSNDQIIFSGKEAELTVFISILTQRFTELKIEYLKNVSHAFHSRLIQPMVEEFRKIVIQINYRAPSVDFISTVTGKKISVLDADYFVNQILSPVLFLDAVQCLQNNYSHVLEIGPKPILIGLIKNSLPNEHPITLMHSIAYQREWATLLSSLAQCYIAGLEINWKAVNAPYQAYLLKTALPTYPFQLQRCWIAHLNAPKPDINLDVNPLLGESIESAALKDQKIFQASINIYWPDFIEDHKLYGIPVIAGAAYISALLSAIEQLKWDAVTIQKINFSRPVVLTDDRPCLLQTLINLDESKKTGDFTIFSQRKNKEWDIHVEGKISQFNLEKQKQPITYKEQSKKTVLGEDIYNDAQKVGLILGEKFKWIQALYLITEGEEVFAEFRQPSFEEGKNYILPPGLIDSCFQVSLGTVSQSENPKRAGLLYVPANIESFTYTFKGEYPKYAYLKKIPSKVSNEHHVSLQLFNDQDEIIGAIDDLLLRPLPQNILKQILNRASISQSKNLFYKIEWKQQTALPELDKALSLVVGSNLCLVFADNNELNNQLLAKLKLSYPKMQFLCIRRGEQYRDLAHDCVVINPSEKEHFNLLFQRIPSGQISNIIYLWSMAQQNEKVDVITQTYETCTVVLYLIQSLVSHHPATRARLFFVTSLLEAIEQIHETNPFDLSQTPLLALRNTISQEYPNLYCLLINIAPSLKVEQKIGCFENEFKTLSNEPRIYYSSDAIRHVARLIEYPQKISNLALPKENSFKIVKQSFSTISSSNLTVVKKEKRPLKNHEVLVKVHATSINYRDVLNAENRYPGDAGPLGLDLAGIIIEKGSEVEQFEIGDSILGIPTSGEEGFADIVVSNDDLIIKKPITLTFEQAACLPIVFLTAYRCLIEIANLQPNETVLIHAGAGGVGLIAIELAKWRGAEILTTASKPKHTYLKSRGITHIMDSRNTDFVKEVMAITEGKGVDVVLNCLSGEGFIDATLSVCAPKARFIELGKINILDDKTVVSRYPSINYTIYALDDEITGGKLKVAALLAKMSELYQKQLLQPLPYTKYSIESLELAFKEMLHAKHIGKLIVEPAATELFDQEACYLITGGLGGLGLKVAEWIAEQGAKHLILVSRRSKTPEHSTAINSINELGADVTIYAADIADFEQCKALLQKINQRPLKGIFHAAGVLKDALIINQTKQTLDEVLAPKVRGAWNLHTLTTQMNIQLDHFVLFSSIVAVNGSPGQINYAAANAFLDGLARFRKNNKLPALTINWGAWAEVGMVVDTIGEQKLKQIGMTAMPSTQGTAALGQAMRSNNEIQFIVADVNWNILFKNQPQLRKDPWYEYLAANSEFESKKTLLPKLRAAKPHQRKNLLVEQLSELFKRIGIVNVDVTQDFSSLGLDSFTSEEIRRRLLHEFDNTIELPPITFTHYPSIQQLADFLLSKLIFEVHELAPEENFTDSQWQRWFECTLLSECKGLNNLLFGINLPVSFDIEKLKTCCYTLVCQSSALLAEYKTQRITPTVVLKQQIDVIPWYEEEIKAEDLETKIETLLEEPFKLATAPLIKFYLFNISNENRKELFILTHSISFDRQSCFIFLKELINLYNQVPSAFGKKNAATAYLALATQEKEWLQHEQSNEVTKFWQNRLKQYLFPSPLNISEKLRQRDNSFKIKTHAFEIAFLESTFVDNTINLQVFCLAVYSLLLHKASKANEFIVGVLCDQREQLHALDMLGQLSNLLPLPITIGPNFLDLLKAIQSGLEVADKNSRLPFNKIVKTLNVNYDKSYHPFLQVVFSWLISSAVKNSLFTLNQIRTKELFDLHLEIIQDANGLKAKFLYNSDLFSKSRMETYANDFISIAIIASKNINSHNITNLIELAQLPGNQPTRFAAQSSLINSQAEIKNNVIVYLTKPDSLPQLNAYLVIDEPVSFQLKNLIDGSIPNEISDSFSKNRVGLKKLLSKLELFNIVTFADVITNINKHPKVIKKLLKLFKVVLLPIFNSFAKNKIGEKGADLLTDFLAKQLESLKHNNNITLILQIIQKLEALLRVNYRNRILKKLSESFEKSSIPLYEIPWSFTILNQNDFDKLITHVDYHKMSLPASHFKPKVNLPALDVITQDFSFDEWDFLSENGTFTYVIYETVLNLCAQLIGKKIQANDNLFAMGAHPEDAVEILAQTEKRYGVAPSLSVLWDKPTVTTIVNYLERTVIQKNIQELRTNPLIAIRAEGDHLPLFFIHTASGLANAYLAIKPYIAAKVPLYGINNPRLEDPQHCFQNIEEMAQDYIKLMTQIQPTGSYRLAGWSFGGVVCIEIAKQLQQQGRSVEVIFLLDTFNMSIYHTKASFAEFVSILDLAGTDVDMRFELSHNGLMANLYDPVKTGKYRGRVVLIKATDGAEPFTRLIEDPTNGWQEIFENPLEIYSVAGNHYSFIRHSAQKVGHIFTAVFNKEKEYLNNQINMTLTKQEQQFFHALQENDIFMVKSFIDFYINHSISINMDKKDSTGKNVFDYAKLYHNEDLENLLKKYFSIILPNYQKTKLSRFFKLSTNSDINVIPEDKRLAPSPSKKETSDVESKTQDASARGTKQDRP